jgi:hypothetical protein
MLFERFNGKPQIDTAIGVFKLTRFVLIQVGSREKTPEPG